MITNTVVRNILVGNGTTRVFQFTFECNDSSNVKIVVKRGDSDEEIISSAYTIDIINKTATYPIESETGIDVLTSDDKICIYRETPQTQILDLTNGGLFDAENLEATFDKLIKIINELNSKIARVPEAPKTMSDEEAKEFLET